MIDIEEIFKGITLEDRINALYAANIINADGHLEASYEDELKKIVGRWPITCVTLGFGYVENSSVGWHVYTYRALNVDEEPPTTAADAVKILAKDFWELYQEEFLQDLDRDYIIKDCCKAYWEIFNYKKEQGLSPKQDALCPKCERELTRNDINLDTFKDWIYELGFSMCDRFPCCDGTGGFGHWWQYSSWKEILELPKGTFLEIPEKAEEIITMALNPDDFEGDNAERIKEFQKGILDFENNFKQRFTTIDEVIEHRTKRPGYGEEIR